MIPAASNYVSASGFVRMDTQSFIPSSIVTCQRCLFEAYGCDLIRSFLSPGRPTGPSPGTDIALPQRAERSATVAVPDIQRSVVPAEDRPGGRRKRKITCTVHAVPGLCLVRGTVLNRL